MDESTNLGDLIARAQFLPENYSLYVINPYTEWSESMECILVDEDEVELSETLSLDLEQSGYTYCFSVEAFQDILTNAKLTSKNLTKPQFVERLKYYFDNDAFME